MTSTGLLVPFTNFAFLDVILNECGQLLFKLEGGDRIRTHWVRVALLSKENSAVGKISEVVVARMKVAGLRPESLFKH